ncbi:hypothetical protein LOK49_LG13G00742 [Camellia lanceoleosa]|uniref:Uncharacterized protein n=1 Tax=Camellia lanceoleosa TaxID=1840588 RepID=A0ACC0FI64_9ERIC|nr:hypothetical protein LOK49_LG13G00742 [Camellia lanceoleosa]
MASEANTLSCEDDLFIRFNSFVLTTDEADEVVPSLNDIRSSVAECALSLIGKVITFTTKPINLYDLKNTMSLIWGNPKGLKILEIGDNLFQFTFTEERDLLCVLNGKP